MGSRLTPRHFPLLAGIAATVALASACGGGLDAPAAATNTPLAKYANTFLSFRHPANWKAYPFRWSGALHFQPMLYVSTQAVRDPCQTSGNSTVCKWPVRRLQPDGVLIAWENRGFPGWSLRTQRGKSIRIDGRSAKRSEARPGACAAIGGDLTIEVAIARPMASNWTEATACVRGPHLAANERRIDSLLASTRFLSS
jgi:hypothetical protein